MRRSGVFRGWAVLWAVLQFALPAAATLADARLERDSAGAPASHIEERSSASCRPSHPDACVLCQFVSRAASPSRSPGLPEIVVHVGEVPESHRTADVARGLTRLSLPRAPPATLA